MVLLLACGGFAAERSVCSAGDIYRPGAQQERCRSTALSSKCGQYLVDSQVDEAEHRPVVIAVLSGQSFVIILQLI